MSQLVDWLAKMAVVHKFNKKIRICIDPQPLNAALIRELYKLAVPKDVL